MCGISGIIQFDKSKVNRSNIEGMNGLIAHRGPDGEGFYFGDNFAFGHRRLAIIDLTENGHQPMIYQDDYIITYNGEVYNYIEIKEELLNLGYSFNSDSDTEVILAAYKCWGTDCVSRFNGMWAFAIYDKKKNIIFCSRDRFGIKPFYYLTTKNQFAFGSEIKQLIQFLPKATVNKKVALDYLIIGIEEHSNETFFNQINKLQGGHNLIFDLEKNSFTICRYFELQLSPDISHLNQTAAESQYQSDFSSSINLRLRSDVKVGTCLSGGLDSSSVAAVAGKEYKIKTGQKFIAIHAKSTEKASDESAMAKEVADFCDLDLQIVEPKEKDFIENIEELVYTQEEPFGSPSVFMQYFVLQKAREINCIVMLDGQGGDETLLGYEKYYPAYLMSLKGLAKWRGFMDASKNSKLTRKQVLFYFFYFTKHRLRLKRLKRRNHYFKPTILKEFTSQELKTLADKYLNIFELQKFELEKTQLPHLLKYEDKNSMRHSIETRLPFLDYRVVSTAVSLKSEHKINQGWTKYILRKIMSKYLPDSITWRKNKLGFNAPEKTWLHSMKNEMEIEIKNSLLLQELIDFQKLDLDKIDLRTKWRLYNFACWVRVYKVESIN